MRWLARWLKREARGRQVCFCVIACVIAKFAYVLCATWIFYLLKIDVPVAPHKTKILISTPEFPLILTVMVFFEEGLFRLPLAIAVERNWSLKTVLACALVLSAIFGFCHGGIHHIFLQGVGGIMLSVLFLKCGGAQKNYAKAFTATSAAHFLFDEVLVLLLLATGATSL